MRRSKLQIFTQIFSEMLPAAGSRCHRPPAWVRLGRERDLSDDGP